MRGDPEVSRAVDGDVFLVVEDERRRLVSLELAAKVLGDITVREVYNRLDAGDLESVHLGKRHLVLVPSIDAYIERLREAESARSAA